MDNQNSTIKKLILVLIAGLLGLLLGAIALVGRS
jgi:hypothetical protein